MNHSFKILDRNKLFYEYFLNKKILEVKNGLSDEELLERIICLASFSWRNHSGYYSDGRIENILFDFGRSLDKIIDEKSAKANIKKLFSTQTGFSILHVATELGEIGGHTRMLYQFLRRHQYGKQLLILTDQKAEVVPRWFLDGVGNQLTIVSLDSMRSSFERSYVLRHISRFCSKVILYHHPYDVIPIMAFSHSACPPVLIDNHAHSWFWLGPSIGDLIFTHSEFHREFTLKTRPVRKVYFLRSTDTENVDINFDCKEKSNAKKRLGISPDTICIITVGTTEKFIPNGKYDFFRTAKKIVARFNNVEIFVIGISNEAWPKKKGELSSQKIHLVGPVSELADYYKAADIYLEALPQPSIGATVNSTPIGMCCPLLKYGAGRMFSTISALQSSLYEKHIGNVKNEQEYLDKLEFLIGNPNARFEIAKEIRENFVADHSREVIERSIDGMLELTRDLRHSPGRIPVGRWFSDDDSLEIAGMSFLQNLRGVISHFEEYLSRRDRIVICWLFAMRFSYLHDVVRYLAGVSKNKMSCLWRSLFRRRRFA
jgi:glycosyltransferase involved in cell wall biosynthesis